MSDAVKLFVAPRFNPAKEDIRILRTYDKKRGQELLYKNVPDDYAFTGFFYVDSIGAADYVLIPQSIRWPTNTWNTYFQKVCTMAKMSGKEVLLFQRGDLTHKVHIDGAIVFKGSAYKSDLRPNEIVIPPYAEDLAHEISLRKRIKSLKPVISFCGYAGFPDRVTKVKYLMKNTALDLAALVTGNQQYRARKRGIFFRRYAISNLKNSPNVSTNFIVRSTFAGNITTTRLDPFKARRDYLENMSDSDFVLSPRGDGNSSVRFYEALSLGRIPILIDTDMKLPLEAAIDYSKFILRVPHTEIHKLAEIVTDFYGSLTDDQFQSMQVAAREAFKSYLRYDAYFNAALPLLKKGGIQALR